MSSENDENSLEFLLNELSKKNPEINESCSSLFFLSVAEKQSVLKSIVDIDPEILKLIPEEGRVEWSDVVAQTLASFGRSQLNMDTYAYSFLALLSERNGNFAAEFLGKYYEKIIESAPTPQKFEERTSLNQQQRLDLKKILPLGISPINLTEDVGFGNSFSPRFWSNMAMNVIRQKGWNIPWVHCMSPFLRKAVALDMAAMNNQMDCPAEMFPYEVFWVDGNEILARPSQVKTLDVVIEEMLASIEGRANEGRILFIDNADFLCEAGNGALFLKLMVAAKEWNTSLVFCGNNENPDVIDQYVTNISLEMPDEEGFKFLATEICSQALDDHFVDCSKYADLIAEKIWGVEDESKVCNLVRFVDFLCSSFRNEKTNIPNAKIPSEGDFADNFIDYLNKLSHRPLKITKSHINRCFELIFVKEIEQSKASSKGIIDLDAILKKTVFGQDEAIGKLHESLIRAKANLREKKGPLGVYLCLGASGTGKTYTAKQLQKAVYGNENIIRLDMSEYSDGTAVTKIFGASAGYIGYDDGAPFLREVQERPRSVVLIDEIEKSHELVRNAFLKIFDEGSAKNNKGESIDFSQTIIIVTGNVGSAELAAQRQRTMAFVDQETDEQFEKNKKESVMAAIKQRFSPEFLNRMTEIVIYNNLGKESVRRIVEFELSEIKAGCRKKGCEFSFDSGAVDLLVEKSVSPLHNGGRLVGKVVRDEIETPLALEVLKKNPKKAVAKGINQKIELRVY